MTFSTINTSCHPFQNCLNLPPSSFFCHDDIPCLAGRCGSHVVGTASGGTHESVLSLDVLAVLASSDRTDCFLELGNCQVSSAPHLPRSLTVSCLWQKHPSGNCFALLFALDLRLSCILLLDKLLSMVTSTMQLRLQVESMESLSHKLDLLPQMQLGGRLGRTPGGGLSFETSVA